jgi:hypothetical protein
VADLHFGFSPWNGEAATAILTLTKFTNSQINQEIYEFTMLACLFLMFVGLAGGGIFNNWTLHSMFWCEK